MGYDFKAFGLESWGAWGPQATAVLKQITGHAENTGTTNTTAMAGWGAPHIAEVARQWISIELRTEEARMIRRAIATRQMSAARQRAVSDATLAYGNDNDDDIDMENRGPNAANRRRENYHNYNVRHLSENERRAQQVGGAAEFTANSRRRNQMSVDATMAAIGRYNEHVGAEGEQQGQDTLHDLEASEVPTRTSTREAPRQERQPHARRTGADIIRNARLPRANERNNGRRTIGGWRQDQLDSQPLLAASVSMQTANEASRAPSPREDEGAEEEERRQDEEAEAESVEIIIAESRRGATSESINALENRLPTREEAGYINDVYDASLNVRCAICQEHLLEDDNMLVMPCGHAQHDECLRNNLAVTNLCPVCRHELPLGRIRGTTRRYNAITPVTSWGALPANSMNWLSIRVANTIADWDRTRNEDRATLPLIHTALRTRGIDLPRQINLGQSIGGPVAAAVWAMIVGRERYENIETAVCTDINNANQATIERIHRAMLEHEERNGEFPSETQRNPHLQHQVDKIN